MKCHFKHSGPSLPPATCPLPAGAMAQLMRGWDVACECSGVEGCQDAGLGMLTKASAVFTLESHSVCG